MSKRQANPKKTTYKIYAAPKAQNGNYWAWPDKTIYVREFSSEGRRRDYWRRFVVMKSTDKPGPAFQLVMVDEWNGGWDFVSEARYAEEPIIAKPDGDRSPGVVEC